MDRAYVHPWIEGGATWPTMAFMRSISGGDFAAQCAVFEALTGEQQDAVLRKLHWERADAVLPAEIVFFIDRVADYHKREISQAFAAARERM